MKKIFLIIFFVAGIGLFLRADAALADISAPALIAPDDKVILPPSSDITFKWDPVPEADKGYHYLVLDPKGKTRGEQKNYQDTQKEIKNFAALGDYTWQVQACQKWLIFFTKCSDSELSKRTFTIANPLEKPLLSSPENGVTVSLTPTLQWSWNGDPDKLQGYNIEISGELATGEQQKIFYTAQNFYNVEKNYLKYNKVYSWKVRAKDKNYKDGPWSDPFVFTTEAAPPPVEVPPPVKVPPEKEIQPCPPNTPKGLVLCGRSCDVIETPENEAKNCEFCHLFVMGNNIIWEIFKWVVPTIAVLMLIIGGVMLLFAGAKPELLNQAKGMITSVAIGLLIIFAAWVIVNTVFDKAGIIDMPAGWKWYEVGCEIK